MEFPVPVPVPVLKAALDGLEVECKAAIIGQRDIFQKRHGGGAIRRFEPSLEGE